MTALIHIENLTRRYPDLCAVDDISFELQAGEVLGFLGPNGAGKSTTMQIISGVLAPSSGQVRVNGFDLQTAPVDAKRSLGYLPEAPPLYPEMRVDEYLAYCARLHGVSASEIDTARTKAKQRCGLDEVGRRLINNLSKGYQQRVGIAQAIIHQPRVIILDEPTSGLDPNQIQEIRALIRELADECGILLSTHILPEVQALCDRVLILHQGRLVYSASLVEQAQRLLIELGSEVGISGLNRLPGVVGIEPLGRYRFRLTLDSDTSPAEIARALVEQGAELYELHHDQDNLERIFSQVTLGEALP